MVDLWEGPIHVFTKRPNKNLITLYHGSDKIIEKPMYGKGSRFNDYGLGFYTTPHWELAAEWAVPTEEADGYVNEYTIELTNLKVLDLDQEPFEHWVSVLIQNRGGRYSRPVRERHRKYLDKFPFSIEGYDIIKGWRADDSYFRFVRDFFNVGLSIENLREAMTFGELGTQYCLLTQKAFDKIEYKKSALSKANIYFPKRKTRDDNARQLYDTMENMTHGNLIFDIIGRD